MKCKVCGEEYPSKYYFKEDMICNSCFEKLPKEKKEKQEKAEAIKKKVDELVIAQSRKYFWIGSGVGLVIAFIFEFLHTPWGFFLGPLVAGLIAQSGARGAGAGFLSLFVWGATFIFRTPVVSELGSIMPFIDVAGGSVIAALTMGLGFGIWPGAILGLVGGLIGKLISKIKTSA
ncbi:MAG: hypothetical protein R6V04_15315 [bacterium]